ncbi:MAG: hypothetical protein KBC57_00245 [Neisseriaceae bacterium]|nr:hypothetical protein [Neisseriaceae bacterium]
MNLEDVLNELETLKQPIEYDELLRVGALKQKGKSYYIVDINLIPKNIQRKIKTLETNKNGLKVTF